MHKAKSSYKLREGTSRIKIVCPMRGRVRQVAVDEMALERTQHQANERTVVRWIKIFKRESARDHILARMDAANMSGV